MNASDADRQIKQMVNFILQEAREKANEIRIKVKSVEWLFQSSFGRLKSRISDFKRSKRQSFLFNLVDICGLMYLLNGAWFQSGNAIARPSRLT